MKDLDLELLEKTLIKQRDTLLARAKAKKNVSPPIRTNPDHFDLAQDYLLKERNSVVSDRSKRKIARLDEALQRMKNGTYGICARCNQEISLARLKALPYAELCIECQAKKEKKGTPIY